MSFKSRTSSNKPAFQSQDYRRQKPHHTHFLDDYQPSLFVSPIECNVSRGCLMDYFEQFGRVRLVTVKQERLREDLYNGVPARLFYEDRRRDRHTWKVSEYKERERQAKPAASPAIKAPVVIQTAPAPTDEELRIAKSTETTLKVEKSLANGRKTRFSPKVEVAVPQAQEVLDEAEAFLAETFSQLRLDNEGGGQVSPVVQEDEEEEEDTPVYERFSTDNPSEQVVFKVDYGEVPPARKRGRKIIIKKL